MAVKLRRIGPSKLKKTWICLRRLLKDCTMGFITINPPSIWEMCFKTVSKHTPSKSKSQYEQNRSKLRIPKLEPNVLSHSQVVWFFMAGMFCSNLDAYRHETNLLLRRKKTVVIFCCGNLTMLKVGFEVKASTTHQHLPQRTDSLIGFWTAVFCKHQL